MQQTEPRTVLRPTGERLIVKKAGVEERTPGGIIVPEKAQKAPVTGTVVAAGPGKLTGRLRPEGQAERLPMCAAVGDKILFGRYDSTDVNADGEDFAIVEDSKVLAILEADADVTVKPYDTGEE